VGAASLEERYLELVSSETADTARPDA
jgi:hypothetical protein